MFDKDAIFLKGKHATYTKRLVAKFNNEMKQGIFARNLDVYMMAPLVGKLYNRKAEEDTGDDTRINKSQIDGERKQLETIYRTLMLLENKDTLTAEERCNRAFQYDSDDERRKDGDKIFDSYVRGGIEVLYEKIMDGAKNEDDYVHNLHYFMVELKERCHEKLNLDEIREMCELK